VISGFSGEITTVRAVQSEPPPSKPQLAVAAPAAPLDEPEALRAQLLDFTVVERSEVGAHDPRQQEIRESRVAGQGRAVHVGGDNAAGDGALASVPAAISGSVHHPAQGSHRCTQMGDGAVVLVAGERWQSVDERLREQLAD